SPVLRVLGGGELISGLAARGLANSDRAAHWSTTLSSRTRIEIIPRGHISAADRERDFVRGARAPTANPRLMSCRPFRNTIRFHSCRARQTTSASRAAADAARQMAAGD